MMAPLRENLPQPPKPPNHQGHAKSVSPQKEVIWRRSTSIAPSNNGYRSDTATNFHPFRQANRRSMLASMNHIPSQPMPPHPPSRRPYTMMEPPTSFDPYADQRDDAASFRRMQYQQRRQMSALQLSLAEQAQEMDRDRFVVGLHF
uniref:Uncharacterized protein n=1 Tax=Panagrellus redivivus TaxID=6233 RepID=A0A7E4VAY1_PANRE